MYVLVETNAWKRGEWDLFLGLQGCRRDWFYMKRCMKKNKSSGLLVGPDVI